MQLTAVERFALQMLFREQDMTSTTVRTQLDKLDVVTRKTTEVGFFTTIRPVTSLPNDAQCQWDWNFEHRHLSHGGSFMCWLDDSGVLELEAVTHNGGWPDHFDPNDFSEQKI
ncbi:MAG: hypothetical protein FWD51_01780 [Betaproteobacteria bacterium]|nr:hypothetical protein [Betaproteobacteria bacterium]